MDEIIGVAIIALLFIVGFCAAVALQGIILMWAWNIIVFTLFHGPHITFIQSVAITFLLSSVGAALNFLTGGFFRKPTE